MSGTVTRRQFLTRSGLVAGSAVAAPALLTACGGSGGGGDSDVFRVGAVLELSGADATGGQIARRGYEFWADTVNKKGGIKVGGKRYKVDLMVQDCKSQPSTGADAAARLITQKGADAMFGAYTSGVQIAMNPICAKYQVPCIAGSAESPENWKPQPKFTYGIIPSVDLTANNAIKFIAETAKTQPGSGAVVGVNEPFSKDTAKGFRDGVKAAGLDLTHYSLFPKDADLVPIARVVASQKPEVVAVGGHDVLLVDFVKALKSVQYTPKAVIEHYGITDSSFAKALGKDAEGVLGISVWLSSAPHKDELFGSAAEYAKAFKKKYDAAADYTAAGCTAAGRVLGLALQKLGQPPSLDQGTRAKLNQILAKTDVETFYGKIKFDSSGDHFHDNSALDPILVQIQKGTPVAVAPHEAASAQMRYPLDAWSAR